MNLVYTKDTLSIEQSRHPPTSIKYFAFDSFEGLPENNEGGKFAKGQYAGSLEYVKDNLRKRGALRDNTFFYKGFYDETLTHDLQQ